MQFVYFLQFFYLHMYIIDRAIVAIMFYKVGSVYYVKGTSEHGFNRNINDSGYFLY